MKPSKQDGRFIEGTRLLRGREGQAVSGGEPTEEPQDLVMVLAGDNENGFAFDLVDEPVLVGDAAGPEA
jgi:hypothetical protein